MFEARTLENIYMARHQNEKALKLVCDPIPEISHHKNLRYALSKQEWQEIRKKTLAAANYCCQVCESPERLECDEEWEYDYETEVQRFKGCRAVCFECHRIKHIGRTTNLVHEGRIKVSELIAHFWFVNGGGPDEFERERDRSYVEYQRRNQVKWRIDLGEYENRNPWSVH